jgi:hypothetical protein
MAGFTVMVLNSIGLFNTCCSFHNGTLAGRFRCFLKKTVIAFNVNPPATNVYKVFKRIDEANIFDEPGVEMISIPVKTVFTPVKINSTSVKIVFTTVETISTPVKVISTSVETVFTPVKAITTHVETISTPVKMIFTPVETVSTSVEMSGMVKETTSTVMETTN